MTFAQTTVEAPKDGASSRETEISVASVPAPTRNATTPSRRPPRFKVLALVLRLVGLVGRVGRLVRRDGHLLRRDLGRDDGDVHLVLVLAIDEDRRADAELAAEDEVRQRILDETLDRTAQRPGPHRRVVALLDEQLLRAVGQLDRGLVLAHLVAQALH